MRNECYFVCFVRMLFKTITKSLQFRWYTRCNAMVLWTTNFGYHCCSSPMKCKSHGAETSNIEVRLRMNKTGSVRVTCI
jgi:hypothetical protein